MHQLPGKRALALIFGLATAAAGSAYAQDTTDMGGASMDSSSAGAGALDTTAADSMGADSVGADSVGARDTTDTSGVQNPPGYRGMERDTTIFPDSGSAETSPGQVEDRATGTYDDSTWQDTTGAAQNPAGYRGMGRAPGDTAANTDTTASRDTTEVGDTEPKVESTETPRLEPSESGAGDSTGQSPDSTQ